jgi:hypothetical protein
MPRKRVGFLRSFKAAWRAAWKVPERVDAAVWLAPLFGFWWWIRGLPEETPPHNSDERPGS